ncbi:MAG: hypothetical protein ACO3S8_02405 [Aquiluna sp.]
MNRSERGGISRNKKRKNNDLLNLRQVDSNNYGKKKFNGKDLKYRRIYKINLKIKEFNNLRLDSLHLNLFGNRQRFGEQGEGGRHPRE